MRMTAQPARAGARTADGDATHGRSKGNYIYIYIYIYIYFYWR